MNIADNPHLHKSDVISRLEQAAIIDKAVIKFGDLNKVSKWCGVPVWLLQNVLKGNEIRQTQYDKMVWMRYRPFIFNEMNNDKLKSEIEDLKQVIFRQKSDFEMEKWEQSKNDLDFLKELQGRMKNWDEKNDWTERDYAFKMVEDWIEELTGVVNAL